MRTVRLPYDPLSTKRRQPGILVHVHPVLPRIAEASQLQLRRLGPDGQPNESSQLDNGVSLDFANAEGPVRLQHYALLISEADFDAVLGQIHKRGIDHWADPMRRHPGEINHADGGRGVCFLDPEGHQLEVITRPYGSGAS